MTSPRDPTTSVNNDKPKVLILGPLDTTLPIYQTEFLTYFEVINYRVTTKQQLLRDLQTPELNSISAIYAGWLGLPGMNIDSELIGKLPESLKIITVCSAGFSPTWDIKQLRSRSIDFCNTPTLGAAQVADMALAMTLDGFRKLKVIDKHTRLGSQILKVRSNLEQKLRWDGEIGKFVERTNPQPEDFAFGHDLGGFSLLTPQGKTAVIVGFGTIGKSVGKRLDAIGMDIRYVKRTKLSDGEAKELGYPAEFYDDLQKAVKGSKLIVLCLPGTADTKGVINKEIIDLCDSTVLVNVGRGMLLDEQAVLRGLKEGKLRHFGTDVYPDEPHINPELITREDTTLTPHIGSSTIENYDNTAIFCLQNIIDRVIFDKKAQNLQN